MQNNSSQDMGRRKEMDGVERQTAPGDPEILHNKTQADAQCYFCCMVVILTLVVTACVFVPIWYYMVDADYLVGIDTASVLDPMTGLSFNLTLGIVISHSHGPKACVNPGLYAEVSYHGVQLAASAPEAGQLCAEPGKPSEKHVPAMATALPVGRVLDSLMEDMKKDAAVFDVALHIPAGSYGSYGGMASYYRVKWLTMCEGRRVGATAALCDSSDQEELYA